MTPKTAAASTYQTAQSQMRKRSAQRQPGSSLLRVRASRQTPPTLCTLSTQATFWRLRTACPCATTSRHVSLPSWSLPNAWWARTAPDPWAGAAYIQAQHAVDQQPMCMFSLQDRCRTVVETIRWCNPWPCALFDLSSAAAFPHCNNRVVEQVKKVSRSLKGWCLQVHSEDVPAASCRSAAQPRCKRARLDRLQGGMRRPNHL